MSDAAVQKLLLDKETYESELKALTQAAKPEAICAQIVAKIVAQPDPMLDPTNPWLVETNGEACCIVM